MEKFVYPPRESRLWHTARQEHDGLTGKAAMAWWQISTRWHGPDYRDRAAEGGSVMAHLSVMPGMRDYDLVAVWLDPGMWRASPLALSLWWRQNGAMRIGLLGFPQSLPAMACSVATARAKMWLHNQVVTAARHPGWTGAP